MTLETKIQPPQGNPTPAFPPSEPCRDLAFGADTNCKITTEGSASMTFQAVTGYAAWMLDHGEDAQPSRGAVTEVYTLERVATLEYSPDLDGLADPGEVVWAWVPYEEDPGRGKDRPLLVVGRHGRRLLAMMLSSRGHEDSPDWLELGSGDWDREDRPSYLRLDRVFALEEGDIRREGAVLDPERFARVAAVLVRMHGWKATR